MVTLIEKGRQHRFLGLLPKCWSFSCSMFFIS